MQEQTKNEKLADGSQALHRPASDDRRQSPPRHDRISLTFDELGLPDDQIFIHIPRVPKFVCDECGSREFKAWADWKEFYEVGERNRIKALNDPVMDRMLAKIENDSKALTGKIK